MAEEARSVVRGAQFQEAVQPEGAATPVQELPTRVKKVVTTDEGKLQVVLEAESLSDDAVEKVKGLLSIQQGMVLATFEPAQGDLFGFDA